MRRIFSAILFATTFALPSDAFAADTMSMGAAAPMAMTAGYQFELAGPVQSKAGMSIVSVRIVHAMDKKPVLGAVFIQSRADMGPIGMAAMTAPIKALGEQPPGTYRFEVENGPVWKKPDNWSLSFAVKVQGVPQTVTGSVVVKLTP
jgi:hypothetical protein